MTDIIGIDETKAFDPDIAKSLRSQLDTLRKAFVITPYPDAKLRRDRLRRAIEVLIRNEQRIVDALQSDFGGRPEALSLLIDVMAPVRSLRHALRNVTKWMRLDRRQPEFPMGLIGGKASVFYQPLGVVGIVSPWNAPIALTFSPLASALAAGNSALIKPSELVPQTAELIAEMIGSAFDKTEVQAALGGADVARMFTALPFDHLIFTGGAAIARTVLAAAAPNLVPVTLELGGKAPAIVAKGSDIKYAASKIISGKFVNAGQACLAPDFVLVHRSDMTAFTEAARMAISRMYPDLSHNSDYTRVHLSNQRNRLIGLVEEAERCGAAIEVFGGETVNSLSESPRFPPVLIIDPPFHTQVMRTEIFGPVLPIVPYQTLADVVALLASLERPLALYYIGGNPSEKDYLLQNTYSGGVTFDDVMLHPFMQDLPFGGVGESGMGRYVGYDGFKALSNGKGVVQRPWIDLTRFVSPPFKPGLSRALRRVIRF